MSNQENPEQTNIFRKDARTWEEHLEWMESDEWKEKFNKMGERAFRSRYSWDEEEQMALESYRSLLLRSALPFDGMTDFALRLSDEEKKKILDSYRSEIGEDVFNEIIRQRKKQLAEVLKTQGKINET